jgi:peptidoglycan/LPS O-acetylase OafA/YrhL
MCPLQKKINKTDTSSMATLNWIGKIYRFYTRWYTLLLKLFFSTLPGRWIFSIFRNLKVYQVLKTTDRISSLDVFRAIAIIAVVIYHYHHILNFGNLGVDLFFVISGLLVGGILTKEFEKDQKINIPKFLLQRGFKIWPSFYFLLTFGSLMAFLMYRNSHSSFIIPFRDINRYIFFYQNYIDQPEHWTFDHIWSLCVEEHFYIMLPIVFFTIQLFISRKNKLRALYVAVFMAIVMGIVFKYFSLFYTAKGDTYTGTHNRIDALAWGVLLNLILTHYGDKLKQIRWLPVLSIIGILLFSIAIYINRHTESLVYHKIVLQSFVPICFFLIILGVYFLDFSKLYLLRTMGYYSYNWYLWHPMFVWAITDILGPGRIGLGFYMVVSLLMAVLATVTIEEPFLEMRKKVIPVLFKKAPGLKISAQTS